MQREVFYKKQDNIDTLQIFSIKAIIVLIENSPAVQLSHWW
jgi:hypothetical protein